MARPQSVTDDQIRDAAREVFVRVGPNAPVSAVAKELGVTHAALFRRVGSKERLLLSALQPESPRAIEWLREAPPDEGIHARLVDILLDLMAFLQRVVPNLVVLRGSGRSLEDLPRRPGPPPPVALRSALATWLDAAISRGSLHEALGTEVLADALLGAMEARCFNGYLGGRDFTPGDDAKYIKELVAGLVPSKREQV